MFSVLRAYCAKIRIVRAGPGSSLKTPARTNLYLSIRDEMCGNAALPANYAAVDAHPVPNSQIAAFRSSSLRPVRRGFTIILPFKPFAASACSFQKLIKLSVTVVFPLAHVSICTLIFKETYINKIHLILFWYWLS